MTFFFPLDRRGYEVPCPRPAHRSFADPSGNILGSKAYTGATIRTNFFRFFFFSFWIFSFCYSLLFLLSFSISSYSSLLISSYSSRRAILHLLILLLLYFKLFVVLHTCILTIYLHIYVILRDFSKRPSLFYLLIRLFCTIFFLFLFFSYKRQNY
jgi:hypothetical protein